ncbi:hypothetical protein LSAT2_023299 [Lamellibrachia satsuma]|nr:hypothetical protein LSAT2_023299 [Lamellibrachia satsuma]
MTHLTQRIIVTYATRNPQPQQTRGPCNPSAPARCHTRNILLDRLTCFLTSAMYSITVLLVVSLCLASGQRTDVPLDSCTYSFVVQSPHCWRGGNTGWESEVAILKETVASLSDRLKDVDQTMQELKKGTSTAVDAPRPAPLTATVDDRTVYVYIGCPRDININIVHFVPLSLQPTPIRVISVNFSETDNGQRVLLTPTMSPFPIFCTFDKYITIQRRRFPSVVSFNKTWDQYKTGFGDISGDFWLGLEKLYQITSQPHVRYSLRLELKLNTGVHYYSEYKDFHIADESRKYMLVSIGQKTAGNVNYFLKSRRQSHSTAVGLLVTATVPLDCGGLASHGDSPTRLAVGLLVTATVPLDCGGLASHGDSPTRLRTSAHTAGNSGLSSSGGGSGGGGGGGGGGNRQPIDVDDGASCTYSFAVQSRLCTPDPGSKAAVVALHEHVAQLRNQITQTAREISTMKHGKDKSAKYVYLGCPEEMTIDVVNFFPVAIEPTFVQLTSINISQVTDIGERILLEPLKPHFPVFCTVDKYIVIQRRSAPYVASFSRTWEEHKNGFGDVRGEFWLGLEKIHQITRQPFVRFSVRVEAKLATGLSYYAEYNNFYIGDESQNYRILSIGTATAKSNNYFLTNGTFFATADRDHKYLCGARFNGFWYFESKAAGNVGCSQMTLNSDPPYCRGITPLFVLTEMKIRPLRI